MLFKKQGNSITPNNDKWVVYRQFILYIYNNKT